MLPILYFSYGQSQTTLALKRKTLRSRDIMETRPAIQMFLDTRRSSRVSPETLCAYDWALEKVATLYPFELPSTSEEIEFLFRHYSDLATESMVSLRQRLMTFWRWLENSDHAPNIMAHVQPITTRTTFPRTLSTAELELLLAVATSSRDRAIILVLLDTGMRVGELASLTRGNIQKEGDLTGARLRGKTGDRFVPISPEVVDLLHDQGRDDQLWIGLRGPLTKSGLQSIVRRNMRKAGIRPPKLGPHTLRHTFGVHWVLRGGDVFSLQRMMGHSSLTSTMSYVHMSSLLLARQQRKFSPVRDLLGSLGAVE